MGHPYDTGTTGRWLAELALVLGVPPSQLETEDPQALETMIRIITRSKKEE